MNTSTPFRPTAEQTAVLEQLKAFVKPSCPHQAFLLTGAAGTGKTSLIQSLVRYLHQQNINFHIAAPTARAAKIIAAKTAAEATTLHSQIYRAEPLSDRMGVKLVYQPNPSMERTIYIVDEASMIGDKVDRKNQLFQSSTSLLSDLWKYVRSGHPTNKVIFVGDSYQLPPVGSNQSPALETAYLNSKFDVQAKAAELQTIMRQKEDSYILDLASQVRSRMMHPPKQPIALDVPAFDNVWQCLALFDDYYEPEEINEITFLAASNKRVNWLNQYTRQRLGFDTARLAVGERVIAEQRWMGSRKQEVLKGEIGYVISTGDTKKGYAGLSFMKVKIAFPDGNRRDKIVEARVLLEGLDKKAATLENKVEQSLYHEAMRFNPKFRSTKHPADDPFIGALRLRYAYALTVHKAQGGEWNKVIIDPYHRHVCLRWHYTAITRARKEVLTFPVYKGR